MDLGGLSVGMVVGLLLTLLNVANFIYRYFLKAYKLKKDSDESKTTVAKHTEDIKLINEKVDSLMDMKDQLMEINKIQVRNTIVTSCYQMIERGYVETYQLQSLEDMYEMYQGILNGNSYASTMMKKVRGLPIRNDEGNDKNDGKEQE